MNPSWIHLGGLFPTPLYHLGGLFQTPLYHLHPCRRASMQASAAGSRRGSITYIPVGESTQDEHVIFILLQNQ